MFNNHLNIFRHYLQVVTTSAVFTNSTFQFCTIAFFLFFNKACLIIVDVSTKSDFDIVVLKRLIKHMVDTPNINQNRSLKSFIKHSQS